VVIVLMGVSGAGKTTIGKLLSEDLGWPYYEGDDYHPQTNIDKMSRGIPLDDADRAPWLARLHDLTQECIQGDASAILGCSALKQSYRDQLQRGLKDVRFVYLKGDSDVILHRLQERHAHYMKAELLASQFETLEEPEGVPTINVAQDPKTIVTQIKQTLGL